MNINYEQLNACFRAALALTDVNNGDIIVPMKHAAGALILNSIAAAILNGELVIAPAEVPEDIPQQEPIKKQSKK